LHVVVPSLQPLPASVPCSSGLPQTQPSITATGSSQHSAVVSSPRLLAGSPSAVPLIEHLRRLKHAGGTPTSPLLAATATQSTSTPTEPFHASHDVGLKDLLLGGDEAVASVKTGDSVEHEKVAQLMRQSAASSPSPLVAVNGSPDARMLDVAGRHHRQAVILKQLLEDRAEPTPSSPNAGDPFDVSPKVSQHVIVEEGGTTKQSLTMSDLMFGFNSPASGHSTSPSLLTPSSHVQPPFVQLVTSVEDTIGSRQSSPTAQLTFSIAEPTSVSHLWSPPSFTTQLNCVDQLPAALSSSPAQSQTTSVASVKSLMSVASSQSNVALTSNGGLQLKVTPPRVSASRNILLRVSFCLHFTVADFCLSLM